MAGAMPRARFTEIADAGHMAPLEAPDAVNGAIRAFLEEPFPCRGPYGSSNVDRLRTMAKSSGNVWKAWTRMLRERVSTCM